MPGHEHDRVNTPKCDLARENIISQSLTSLDRTLAWAQARDYAGYSKFDAFNSPLVDALVPKSPKVRAIVTALWARQPVNLRPLVKTIRSRNPKGIALFALAYLRRYQCESDPRDLTEAINLLDWLLDNAVPGYRGLCWGYDHDWYGLHFAVGKYQPNIVVTGNVAYALLEAYEVTGDSRFLNAARGTVEFLLKDLEAPVDTPTMRSIGYVPGSQWGVLNINGLAAAIMIRTWQHTGEMRLKDEARRLTAFLVDKQTPYGAWHYAWPARTSHVKHDNYHTGNVLDWILDYCRRSGDESYLFNYAKGLVFYRRHLFLDNGAPKWMSHRRYPFDVHSAAQGLVTFSKAAGEFQVEYLDMAYTISQWAISRLQAPAGYFYYQQGRFLTKKYTLMRWCNAWMAYGLASMLLADRQVHHLESSG